MAIVKKEFLICVDSDGCVMDTMDCKHIQCFGPCLTDVWGLEVHRDAVLQRWNEINLYTRTRGINRFKGLVLMLGEIEEKYAAVEGLSELRKWVENTKELSERALETYIQERFGDTENSSLENNSAEGSSAALRNALAWSRAVNAAVERLPESIKKPFPGSGEALRELHEKAAVAIVSSANQEAVEKEWQENGLLQWTDCLMAQNKGSKQACIASLIGEGYSPDKVLMVGDAPGDYEAAMKNGVSFYPIIPGQEKASWDELRTEGSRRFLEQDDWKAYEKQRTEKYFAALDAHSADK